MDELLKKFNLNFFKKGSDSVIGVDIGSSAIKVVQLKKKGGVAVLESYGEIALGPYADLEVGQATNLPSEKIAQALVDVVTEANITSREGGLAIPFTSSLVTLIQMPSLDEKQLNKMIPLEARKYIPVPITEVTLDWFIVPEEAVLSSPSDTPEEEKKEEKPLENKAQGAQKRQVFKTSVLLVAIHNQVLNKHRDIVSTANLDISFFEIETFSSIRAVVGQTLSATAVLDIGAAKTKMYIVEYGVIKASHLIHRGSQDITTALSKSLGLSVRKAEEMKREFGYDTEDAKAREAMLLSLDHLFAEANRVLVSYQQKYNRNIGQAILTGGGAVLKGLLPLAEKRLETEVTLGDPFAKVETPAFLEDILKEVGPEFSVAVGIALRKLQEVS